MTGIPDFTKVDLAGARARSAAASPDKAAWEAPEGLGIKAFYAESDTTGLDFLDTFPGIAPYLRGPYPAIYVETGINDSQVAYWEPAKYVARLRTLKTDANPLLMSVNLGAGHGGASGRFDALRELSLSYTFMLDQWGLLR